VLLPGFGIVEHLSKNVPQLITTILVIISLLQFPLYGILAGRDLANRAVSKLTMVVIFLHCSGSALAFYGVALDSQWQTSAERYGARVREHVAEEEVSNNSYQLVNLVKWISQSEHQLKRLQAEKGKGASFSPDPEPGLIRNIESQREELERRWQIYRDAGGPAKTPEDVAIIPSPCGKPPAKPTFL